jgi:uncharacterized protein (DUF1015 family)
VPRFEPFRAIRYADDLVNIQLVVAPPYDVISAERRAHLMASDPHNVVRIDLPDEADGPGRYVAAAEAFAAWQAEGVLRRDLEPAFYTYRMDLDDEAGHAVRTIGVLGALELSRPGEGHILPHEQTTPKAKSDRLDLLRTTRANLSAIWGLSPAAGLTALLHDAEPLATWTGSDGTRHQLGRIADASRVEAIREAITGSPIVIADGHHRYETSLTYRDERRAESADGTAGRAERALTFVVELVESELTVLPIHRLLDELPMGTDLVAALGTHFELHPVDFDAPTISAQMAAEGALCLVLADAAYLLVPRPEAMAGVRDLDSSRLDTALDTLGPHRLRFQHGVDHIVDAVRRGDAQAGVLLRPVRVPQIAEIARGGERMPPKSTYFHPKPSTGALFRSID